MNEEEKKNLKRTLHFAPRSAVVVRIIDNFARRLYNMNIKEQVE